MTYRNPVPTVDLLIELDGRPGELVFVERRNEPVGLALPGGFVDEGEWVADAAVREAKEETGLDVELVELFHVYSDPARDRRRHTMSVAFIARARGLPVGGDDAARALVCAPDQLPQPLVFDHATIVGDYVAYRRTGVRPPPRR
ncbi:MAG: NUDIX hydrolase [Deltaproteobacteria bacterium]|nr:NUDIX hydrolase [Deltaproteobacteria bacterium]MCW5806905.1 NUDIX hydrolase [Deltaproteobacteria bacterium]